MKAIMPQPGAWGQYPSAYNPRRFFDSAHLSSPAAPRAPRQAVRAGSPAAWTSIRQPDSGLLTFRSGASITPSGTGRARTDKHQQNADSFTCVVLRQLVNGIKPGCTKRNRLEHGVDDLV